MFQRQIHNPVTKKKYIKARIYSLIPNRIKKITEVIKKNKLQNCNSIKNKYKVIYTKN